MIVKNMAHSRPSYMSAISFISITCPIVALWGRPLGTSLPSGRAVEKGDRGVPVMSQWRVESGILGSRSRKWSESCSVVSDSVSPIQSMEVSRLEYSCELTVYQLSHKGSPRILEWVAYPSPVDLPDRGIEPGSPPLRADSLPAELWKRLSLTEGPDSW